MLKQTNRLKIKSQQNAKIIKLIKYKLSPLSTKTRFFPKINKTFQVSLDHSHSSILSTINEFHINQKNISYQKQLKNKLKNMEIFKKVKIHMEEKKKLIPQQIISQLKSKLPQISLSEYIDLFSKPQKDKQNRQNRNQSEIIKFRRESLVANAFDNVQNIKQKENQKQMTEDQICLMNAKIRRQQNHRKMIKTIKLKRKMLD